MHAIILTALLATGCGTDETSEEVKVELYLLGDRAGETDVEKIARDLEVMPKRDYVDSMDLGTCYLWQGEYFKAAELFEVAARQAEDREQLAVALYAKASAAGYAGQMGPALDAADALVRLDPSNQESAWLRLGLYLHSGDELGVLVARDHVMRLDPEASGHDVFDPVTAAVVGGVVVTAIVASTGVAMVALTPPEDRKEVVVPMFAAVSGVGGTALTGAIGPATGSIDLGRKITLEASQ